MSTYPAVGLEKKETVDQKFKRIEKDPAFDITLHGNAEDECRNCSDVITIKSKSDGDVKLKCGERVYFDNPDPNEKWTWYCGGSEQKARIKGAVYVRATRAATGKVTWEWVQIAVK